MTIAFSSIVTYQYRLFYSLTSYFETIDFFDEFLDDAREAIDPVTKKTEVALIEGVGT